MNFFKYDHIVPEPTHNVNRQALKTHNSALRSRRILDEMLIYLCVNSAFVSVARLDFWVFRGCHLFQASTVCSIHTKKQYHITKFRSKINLCGDGNSLGKPRSQGLITKRY